MVIDVARALGGLGLFLLGMVVMTDGLRALAGRALHRVLLRFTRSPLSGAASGAAVTAVVQSSSATTVATVGFVGAGLMTFPQALGVLFGANIGTTITGWLVALIGFELELGTMMLPLLLVGALLRLFGRGRVRHAGWALAGFALVFVGIEALQQGMAAFEGVVTPERLPADTLGGRLLLVLVGVGITLVTQSSSAGVATALAALHAGAIGFEQAAAMVIGMDVGTTSTTAIATIGGSTATRRTGYSHVVYNLLTAAGALLLLDPYGRALRDGLEISLEARGELALVGFHTTFNTIGVIAVLPFTSAFARLMTRLVPERGPRLTRRLDPAVAGDMIAAMAAATGTARAVAAELVALVVGLLDGSLGARPAEVQLARASEAIVALREFVARIPFVADDGRAPAPQHVAFMHVVDHLDRLVDRCGQLERAEVVRDDAGLREAGERVQAALIVLAEGLERTPTAEDERRLREVRGELRGLRREYRPAALANVTRGALGLDTAIRRLDAMRWLERTTEHVHSIVEHLVEAEAAAGPAAAKVVAEADAGGAAPGVREPEEPDPTDGPRR